MERRERQLAEIQAYLHQYEHDACGLMAVCARDGHPSHEILMRALDALRQMVHRSGDVDGEGDGCGLQLDLPRRLWAGYLTAAGRDPGLTWAPAFAVGHLFVPRAVADESLPTIRARLKEMGFAIHLERQDAVVQGALGPRGRVDAPLFWQLALTVPEGDPERLCWEALRAIEAALPAVHVCSLSTQTAVYKVRGDATTLAAYYPDLTDARCESRAAIGHNRYSTNTATAFERVQPFSLLGHNGEINTIRQLREQTGALGIPLTHGGSDSQELNRTLEGLLYQFGLTLFEAVELLFPPIIGEVKLMAPALQDHYMYERIAWGPFAQGPAALCMRAGDLLAASVDAMGLRPLWLLQTAEALYFSSEQGIVSATALTADPHPLAPGERMGLILRAGEPPQLLDYTELQEWVLAHARSRFPAPEGMRAWLELGEPVVGTDGDTEPLAPFREWAPADAGAPAPLPLEHRLAWGGWSADDQQLIAHMATSGAEPIGSLGWDGPLAALADGRQNLADFFKETVAVVTNPAVDREREIEHFSTRTLIGPRLPLRVTGPESAGLLAAKRLQLRLPVLVGGHYGASPIGRAAYRQVAHDQGTWLLEDLLDYFGPGSLHVVPVAQAAGESLPAALDRLVEGAEAALRGGARLVLIDDAPGAEPPIDPLLLVTALDNHLKTVPNASGTALRRRTALLLRSGWLRNLHDIALAVGLGADAVIPYAMLEVAAEAGALLGDDGATGIGNLVGALQKGLEKVISTLGIHELRGYSRLFASIGLKPELAALFRVENFMGSASCGRGFAALEADAAERAAEVAGAHAKAPSLYRVKHFWPRLWKAAGDAGRDSAAYQTYRAKLGAQERETPVSLRHLLDLKASTPTTGPVDLTIDGYALPLTISGMSFGSQGETAFRAYAEAAKRLEIVAMNGEGGEIPELIGRYFPWRGQQVASGRFGVNTRMLAGSRFIEIKVGQGAKPGEGGHLPGMKVSAKVATARNAAPGTDLISPSNNHDVYSIEDLAQLVSELRTVNPHAKIVVKIPVVPGIGTIAVGVAKAGADIIALCGYDGGTGAARKHALRHAGLPIEIGVRESHLALVAAGIRERVELWGDSGIKSGLDVVKLMLLGANRVGFATLAMVAIGCTICRGCQLDTCHVGIATQVETQAEAAQKGIKSFQPREYEAAVEALVTLFGQIGAEVRALVQHLGFQRAQDLVGRAELLEQRRGLAQLDLTALVLPLAWERSRSLAPVRQIGKAGLGEQIARDGTRLAGDLARLRLFGSIGHPLKRAAGGKSGEDEVPVGRVQLDLAPGSIAGNGLCAFGGEGVQVRIEGGAQDSVGKGLLGGQITILKAVNAMGARVGGSVGKSFAYGAQAGLFMIQGDADSRCGIRLSGADLVLGGTLRGPLQDQKGSLATRSNLKGFAFEYMTRGRVVVLGDPGPWICSGMTGGVVYVRLQPALGLDEAAVQRRLAKGARVKLMPIGRQGMADLAELLSAYRRELLAVGQHAEAASVGLLQPQEFVAIVPESQQTDPEISTE